VDSPVRPITSHLAGHAYGVRMCSHPIRLAFVFLLAPAFAGAQEEPRTGRVQIAGGGGLVTAGAYFTGPGSLKFSSSDALAGALQIRVAVYRSFSIVLAGTYARPDWQLTGVPLIGSAGVPGAGVWFADAALRGELPLGRVGPAGAVAFAQVGTGLAHYSINTSVLGAVVDESATNFALALAAGAALPVADRFGIELMAKDYIASFKSVTDLATFGIEGRRAHTVLLVASGRLSL
jgi:hypothetical protein